MKKLFTILLMLSFSTILKAQHSGNIVYGGNSGHTQPAFEKLYLTDSTFIIDAKVLMNVIADTYVVTFGVADSAATVPETNKKITKRINSFITSLSKMNIPQKDIYVDMTTQSKILDYHIKGNIAEQYLKGFESGRM